MSSTHDKRWEDFLTPESTRERLISVSMYITAFEILKDAIVDRIKSFYSNEFGPDGAVVGPEYKNKVVSRSKSLVYASLDWLIESGVIDHSDLAIFETVKKTRNTLAHELPSIVMGDNLVPVSEHFQLVFKLLNKIERWWIINVEIPTNPDFDQVEIDEVDLEQVVPGSVLILQMMLEVVSGNEELLNHYTKSVANRTAGE